MAGPREIWERFFAACELPQKIQKTYAVRFVEERMQPYMLKELGKEELKDLGVTALGDQLAILRYIKETNGSAPAFKAIPSSSVSSSTSSPYVSSSKTRVVKRGNALTVADSSPIKLSRQSKVIQKPRSNPVITGLRSDEIIRDVRGTGQRRREVVTFEAPVQRVQQVERIQQARQPIRAQQSQRVIIEKGPRRQERVLERRINQPRRQIQERVTFRQERPRQNRHQNGNGFRNGPRTFVNSSIQNREVVYVRDNRR